jgi:hypothetical protein
MGPEALSGDAEATRLDRAKSPLAQGAATGRAATTTTRNTARAASRSSRLRCDRSAPLIPGHLFRHLSPFVRFSFHGPRYLDLVWPSFTPCSYALCSFFLLLSYR